MQQPEPSQIQALPAQQPQTLIPPSSQSQPQQPQSQNVQQPSAPLRIFSLAEMNALKTAFEDMYRHEGDVLHHFCQSAYSGIDQITQFPPETYVNNLGRQLEQIDHVCDQICYNLVGGKNRIKNS